jgi:hypothetical protein
VVAHAVKLLPITQAMAACEEKIQKLYNRWAELGEKVGV